MTDTPNPLPQPAAEGAGGAAAGGDDDLGGLLRGGDLAQRVGLDDAEPRGAEPGEAEHAQEDREEEADPSFDQPHAVNRWGLSSSAS